MRRFFTHEAAASEDATSDRRDGGVGLERVGSLVAGSSSSSCLVVDVDFACMSRCISRVSRLARINVIGVNVGVVVVVTWLIVCDWSCRVRWLVDWSCDVSSCGCGVCSCSGGVDWSSRVESIRSAAAQLTSPQLQLRVASPRRLIDRQRSIHHPTHERLVRKAGDNAGHTYVMT
jgi:hypothetical protein